jgi:hypothetical protein
MFGGKKFLRDGAQIEGVIIASDAWKVLRGGTGAYHVRMLATFEDGTSTEFDQRVHTRDVGMREQGAVVPVRYDASDRTQIAIDESAMRQRRDVDNEQRDAAFQAVADSAGAPADPLDQLQALWDQKRALDVTGSELRRTGAPREQVGAWVHEVEAVDSRLRALRLQYPDWKPASHQ